MKIIVCVKVIAGEINPFDESAIECALKMSDDVTVISMGPASCTDALIPLTRLGVNVKLISDAVFAGSDTLATSYILSCAIKNEKYDLIICGRQSTDGDTAQVGPMLSKMLELPLITNAIEITSDGKKVNTITRVGKEMSELPALVTVERGYILRFPSIFSKQTDIEIINNDMLLCDTKRCGLNGSPTRVLKTFKSQNGKRKCKFIELKDLFPLIEKLKAENRNTEIKRKCDSKLKSVWAVGENVVKIAEEIAGEVILIETEDPEEIAERARREKPEVILWNADLAGRKNAPVAAAALKTGLCADCTSLETDGKILYMYRPAMGGSVIAKIKCMTFPQMATVRTKSESSDIIVSGGRGISDKFDKLKEFAVKLHAEPGASRGLVDLGAAPYDLQIGLTGKTVSPKIYIAVGISGAVHHTCAIEGAGTVIAVNPDKNARIFEYADYGLLTTFNELFDII